LRALVALLKRVLELAFVLCIKKEAFIVSRFCVADTIRMFDCALWLAIEKCSVLVSEIGTMIIVDIQIFISGVGAGSVSWHILTK